MRYIYRHVSRDAASIDRRSLTTLAIDMFYSRSPLAVIQRWIDGM